MRESDQTCNEAAILKQLRSIKITLWVLAIFIVITALITLAGWVVGGIMISDLHNRFAQYDVMEEERGAAIQLPTQGGSPLVSKDRPYYINILEDGSYSVEGETMDLDHLRLKLDSRFRENPNQKVVLRGDAKAYHGATTAALAAASQAGFTSAQIAWDTNPAQ